MQVHNDAFSKDEEKEMKIMDKEEASIDNSVESSVAKEHNSEADELLKTKSDHIKDDEDPKSNYSEEEVPDPNVHIAAKEVCLNNQTVS